MDKIFIKNKKIVGFKKVRNSIVDNMEVEVDMSDGDTSGEEVVLKKGEHAERIFDGLDEPPQKVKDKLSK